MNKKDFTDCLNHLKTKSNVTLSEIIISLNQERFDKIQSYKLKSLSTEYEKIRRIQGIEEWERCRKVVILECLLHSWSEIFSEKYPLSIQEQFKKNAERFLNTCQSRQGWRMYEENVYWKDIGIARQQIFPTGPGIIEAYSGFGLRQGFSINIAQSLRFLNLLFCSGGRSGYYEIHTHTPLLNEFNEKGWFDGYIRMAEMLVKYENIKGVFRSSWFCDPQLENISPRLAYLRKLPLENGAEFFYVGEDRTGNAFAKSKTRLKLYKEGKYKPKTYMMVWPRKQMIQWAKAYITI